MYSDHLSPPSLFMFTQLDILSFSLTKKWPDLQLRTVSGSMALLQSAIILMYVAPVTIQGLADARGLAVTWDHIRTLEPCCCWGHTNLSDLGCHLRPWEHLGPGCC